VCLQLSYFTYTILSTSTMGSPKESWNSQDPTTEEEIRRWWRADSERRDRIAAEERARVQELIFAEYGSTDRKRGMSILCDFISTILWMTLVWR